MRLFKKRNDDAALIAKDRGKVYDLPVIKTTSRGRATTRTKNRRSRSSTGGRDTSDRYKTSPFRKSPHEHPDIPVIDRIPTAIGYQSEGSEEGWYEEKSKCSRYTTPEDEREDMILSDEDDDGADKYSVGKNSQTKNVAGIERLWSDDSLESKRSRQQRMWHQYDEKVRLESYYNASDVSCMEESKNDPIYESPRQNTVKETFVVASDQQSQVASMEITPSHKNAPRLDKPHKAQHLHPTDEVHVERDEPRNEQHLDDIDELRELSAEKLDEPEPPVDHQTSNVEGLDMRTKVSEKSMVRTGRETTRNRANTAIDKASSKDLDAMASNETTDSSSGADDPLATLAATDLLVREIEIKLKALKATAAREKKAVKKMQREHRKSLSRGRSLERTKSLDSKKSKSNEHKRSKSMERKRSKSAMRSTQDNPPSSPRDFMKSFFNGFTVMLFRKSDGSKKVSTEKKEHDENTGVDTSAPNQPTGYLTVVKAEPEKEEVGELKKSGMELKGNSDERPPKNNKHLQSLRRRGVLADKANKSDEDYEMQRLSLTLSDPPEHDEYSGNFLPSMPSLPQPPALVQCLRFYTCAGVADKVDEAIKATDKCRDAVITLCGSPTSMVGPTATTPQPTVEVVLEEMDQPANVVSPVEDKVSRRGFFVGSTKSDGMKTLAPHAHASDKPKQHTKIVEVTAMNLHLDGDSEAVETHPPQRANLPKSSVSVTSIHVPKKIEQNKVEHNDTGRPRHRRRLPRFLQKISSKQEA